MKTKLMAAVAAIAVMAATGAARAEGADAEVTALKAQAAALKKQNQALESRLNKLEKKQEASAQKLEATDKQLAEQASKPAPNQFLAADLPVLKGALPACAPLTLDGPLNFCGITFFGTVDAGLGWASFGLPSSNKLYLGDNFINKSATRSYFGISPNNLSASTLGVKGSTEILPGLSGVFWASTNINPQSGQLANAPGSIIDNNGLNRNQFSNYGDGSRGGQAFNDQLYAGLSSPVYGQLTFGRHKSLTNDLVGAYDPGLGSQAFSVIGYSGTPVAGLGDTADGRWDDSIKYRVQYDGLVPGVSTRFGAIYKFRDGNGGCNFIGTLVAPAGTLQRCFQTENDAGQVDLGFTYGGFDFDGVLGYFHQAVSTPNPLTSAQLLGASTFTPNFGPAVTSIGLNGNTMAANISDNTGWALGGKYTWNQWKFYAGWSHVIYHNPEDNVGIGAQNNQGGYQLSQVNNAAFPHAKLLDTVWTGIRYSYDPKTDIVGAFYMETQNSFGIAAFTPGVSNTASTSLATCGLPAYLPFGGKIGSTTFAAQSAPRSSTCSGQLYGASAFVDYHFTKRFDVYGGFMYTGVTGGMQSSFANASNWAPTAGARFTF